MTELEPIYTVFIRVPFPRGSFVDPPFVEWNAFKDKQLWKILSNTSKNIDIDWNKLALKFDVPLAFLLQQVACLYERQMQQVQAQIRKVRDVKGLSAQIVGGTKSDSSGEVFRVRPGAEGMLREPSASSKNVSSTGPRISGLAYRRDVMNQTATSNNEVRANASQVSPLSCTNTTVTSLDLDPSSSQILSASSNRIPDSSNLQVRPNSSVKSQPRSPQLYSHSSSESSSSDSSSDSEFPELNSVLRRPVRFTQKKAQSKLNCEEDELVFMPIDTQKKKTVPKTGLVFDTKNKMKNIPITASALDSQQHEGPNLIRTSSQIKDKPREVNDGTPSMGSSFSDLDDTSVTQSALEEALASNMQAGGMASRMSSLSQALRSRYL